MPPLRLMSQQHRPGLGCNAWLMKMSSKKTQLVMLSNAIDLHRYSWKFLFVMKMKNGLQRCELQTVFI